MALAILTSRGSYQMTKRTIPKYLGQSKKDTRHFQSCGAASFKTCEDRTKPYLIELSFGLDRPKNCISW